MLMENIFSLRYMLESENKFNKIFLPPPRSSSLVSLVIVRIISFGQGERNDVHNYLGMRYFITMHRQKYVTAIVIKFVFIVFFFGMFKDAKCNEIIFQMQYVNMFLLMLCFVTSPDNRSIHHR